MDFPSFATLFDIGRTEALIRNPQLSRDAIDRPGSDGNILVAAAAAAADEVVGQLVQVAAGLYMDSATGDALDRLLADRYGLLRKTASAGVGQARFSLPTSNTTPFTIPPGTQIASPDGIKYETTSAVLFPAGVTYVYVPIRSLLAGVSQQVRPQVLTNLLSQIPTAPATIEVTNPQATAGAQDRESDTDFRARGRAFFTTARRGTVSAIVQGALTVPGVTSASVFEGLDIDGNPASYVECIIADQYTDALANLNVVPPTYSTQSQQLSEAVVAALFDYRPAGIYVYVRVASVVMQPITLSLSYRAGADVTTAANQARAAVVNYVNSLAPGVPLDPDDLVAQLRQIDGLYVTGNEVVVPAGEVIPKPIQVLRTSSNIVNMLSADGT